MTTYCFAALLLFLIAFCRRSSTEDTIAVNVKYSKDPVGRMEGQSLTLKCTVEYDKVQCGGIKASWCLQGQLSLLTNPDRYLIYINETKMAKKTGFRQRDVFIQFKNLSLIDTGIYQCTGVCQNHGTSAMGWLLNLTVTENPNKNQENGQNWSDRCSVDMILLVVSFTLSWIPEM